MPAVTAKRQCPDLIFVKPRFEVCKAVSQQIREILAEHTPIIEPLSLDEAYLDVTDDLQGIPLARDVAWRAFSIEVGSAGSIKPGYSVSMPTAAGFLR